MQKNTFKHIIKTVFFYTFLSYLTLNHSIYLHGSQEPEVKQPDKPKTIISFKTNKNDIPYVYRDTFNDPTYVSYTMRAFVLCEKSTIDAMNTAKQSPKKASINISVGPHFQNKLASLPTGTTKDKDEHRKTLVAFEQSPSKKTNPDDYNQSIVISGSANISHNVWPNGNDEAILIIKNNEELALEIRTLLLSSSPQKNQKDTVHTTPEKIKAFGSKKHDLNDINAQRILNAANSSTDDHFVYTRTMNINDKNIEEALKKAAESGADTRIIVHKTALTKNGIPILKSLNEAGVHVSIHYPEKGKTNIMHVKDVITPTSYTNSTANFTQEGNDQNNVTIIVPNNKEIITAAKDHFAAVEKKCIPLKIALKLYEEEKKQKEEEKKKKIEEKKKAQKEDKKQKARQDRSSEKKSPKKTQKGTKRKASSDNIIEEKSPKKRITTTKPVIRRRAQKALDFPDENEPM